MMIVVTMTPTTTTIPTMATTVMKVLAEVGAVEVVDGELTME